MTRLMRRLLCGMLIWSMLGTSAFATMYAGAHWSIGEPGDGDAHDGPSQTSASINSDGLEHYPPAEPDFSASASADIESYGEASRTVSLIADANATAAPGATLGPGTANASAEWLVENLRIKSNTVPTGLDPSTVFLYVRVLANVAVVDQGEGHLQTGFGTPDGLSIGGIDRTLFQSGLIVNKVRIPLTLLTGGSDIDVYVLGEVRALVDGLGSPGTSNAAINVGIDLRLGNRSGHTIDWLDPNFSMFESGSVNTADYVEYGAGGASPSLVATLPGDYNYDSVVDAADYVVWRKELGGSVPLINDDTAGVGPDDYTRWREHFGESVATGGSAASTASIPEPQTATLVLLGLAFLGVFALRPCAQS